MILQQNTKQLTDDQKFQQNVQTWHEPAIHTLEKLLETRKAYLRKRKNDENKAAVLRNEFMQALHDEHPIEIWYAGEIVSSLKRAGKIHCFGNFIDLNLPEKKEDGAK